MEIANDITSLVGKTPLVKLERIRKHCNCFPELIAKLESFNPSASVKDRIAYSMLSSAEKKGLVEPSKTTLIEATSGNTGIALAMVAAAKRYSRRKSKSPRKQGQNFTLREIAEQLAADGYTDKILSAQSIKNLLAQKVPA